MGLAKPVHDLPDRCEQEQGIMAWACGLARLHSMVDSHQNSI